jgi:hypothetical protein
VKSEQTQIPKKKFEFSDLIKFGGLTLGLFLFLQATPESGLDILVANKDIYCSLTPNQSLAIRNYSEDNKLLLKMICFAFRNFPELRDVNLVVEKIPYSMNYDSETNTLHLDINNLREKGQEFLKNRRETVELIAEKAGIDMEVLIKNPELFSMIAVLHELGHAYVYKSIFAQDLDYYRNFYKNPNMSLLEIANKSYTDQLETLPVSNIPPYEYIKNNPNATWSSIFRQEFGYRNLAQEDTPDRFAGKNFIEFMKIYNPSILNKHHNEILAQNNQAIQKLTFRVANEKTYQTKVSGPIIE